MSSQMLKPKPLSLYLEVGLLKKGFRYPLTGVLMRRGNLNTQRNTRDAQVQREDHTRTYKQEDTYLQAKERASEETKSANTLILNF